jgi:hypothetical protein
MDLEAESLTVSRAVPVVRREQQRSARTEDPPAFLEDRDPIVGIDCIDPVEAEGDERE